MGHGGDGKQPQPQRARKRITTKYIAAIRRHCTSKVAQINLDRFESACVEIALPINTRLGRALCRCRARLGRTL